MYEDKDDFLTDRLNYAIVVSGTIEDIKLLKEQVAKLDITVLYQTTSYGELLIVKGTEHGQ